MTPLKINQKKMIFSVGLNAHTKMQKEFICFCNKLAVRQHTRWIKWNSTRQVIEYCKMHAKRMKLHYAHNGR